MRVLLNRVTLLLATSLIATNAFAQTLSSLFTAEYYFTNISVPFELDGVDPIEVVSIQFPYNQASCKSLKDPFDKKIFHIRCQEGGDAVLRVNYLRNGQLESLISPTLTLISPTGGVIVDPDPGCKGNDCGGGGSDPDIETGRNLYNVNCLNCHGGTTLRGRSASQIRSAINSVTQMSGFRSMSDSDVNKISKYLGSL